MRRTPAASLAAVGVAAADGTLPTALASRTVRQNKRRSGLGSLRAIIGWSPVIVPGLNAAPKASGEIGRRYRIDTLASWTPFNRLQCLTISVGATKGVRRRPRRIRA